MWVGRATAKKKQKKNTQVGARCFQPERTKAASFLPGLQYILAVSIVFFQRLLAKTKSINEVSVCVFFFLENFV